MLIKTTTKTKEFKNTATQNYGGWKLYLKLLKEAKKQYKENKQILNLSLIKIIYMWTAIYAQCIFKPFKQFYYTITLSEGFVSFTKSSETEAVLSLNGRGKRIRKHYLFGIYSHQKTLASSLDKAEL